MNSTKEQKLSPWHLFAIYPWTGLHAEICVICGWKQAQNHPFILLDFSLEADRNFNVIETLFCILISMCFVLYLCKQVELHSNHRATDQNDVFVCLQLMNEDNNELFSIWNVKCDFIYVFTVVFSIKNCGVCNINSFLSLLCSPRMH